MHDRSRTEYSMLNILTGVGGYILNTILGFLCRVVFVECLSADYLGVNGLFSNILAMLSLAELGISGAVGYALYKPLAEHDEEKIASLMKLYARAYRIIGLVISLAGLALMPFLDLIIREQPSISESIWLLYVINLFNTASTYFFSCRTTLLITAQRNYIVLGINYVITISQSILQMVFLLRYRNYLSYLLIQTAGILLYNVLVSWMAGKQFPCILKKDVRPLPEPERKALFSNIRDLMLYNISGVLVNSTDNILITFFSGLASSGITSNYTLLVTTLNSLLNQVFGGVTASVGNLNACESGKKPYEMFCFLNLLNFWVFGWGTLGIFYCASDLVELCFGAEYVLQPLIPFVMGLNFFSVGMMHTVSTYKHTLGLFRYGRFIQLFTGILNILFSIFLGRRWGVFGILLATFLARACTCLWYDPYAVFTRGFGRSPLLYARRICWYLTVFVLAAGLCQLSFLLLPEGLVARTLLRILLCSAAANLVFLAAFFRTPEFARLLYYIRRVLEKLRRK